MKRIWGLVGLLATAPLTATELTLTFNQLTEEKGQLVVQVYNSDDTWMSDENSEMVSRTVYSAADLIAAPQVTLELADGEYAVYVYQDLDSNNELKTNWIGIPREPIGVSNDAKGKMGPPSWDDAKFAFDAEHASQSITIKAL